MAKTRLFGESISPGVIKQLERRAEVLSRGVRNSNDLRYLNEKTSWVRMISGVDTQDAENNFTSEEAKGFILSGGELEWDGKRFIRRRGFNTGNNEEERGRYNYDKDLGIRPEAGITSFNIKHIGTYGVLREADINFNVWTRKDLEKAQNLFLRPGMSVVVEWGNSIYLDGNGNVKDTLNLPNPEDYFKKATPSSIAGLLKKGKGDNSYNYDVFLGYITNFTWSFRLDGGYNCSVKAVTKGAVLESLTVYKSTNQALREAGGQKTSNIDNIGNDENKTYLHYVASILKNFAEKFVNPGGSENSKTAQQTKIANIAKEININIIELLRKQGIAISEESGINNSTFFYNIRFTQNKSESITYISLNTFCALLNIGFNFQTPTGAELPSSFFIVRDNTPEAYPSYCTSKNHFSLNPLYCVLPKPATVGGYNANLGQLHTFMQAREKGNETRISSIYINLVEVLKDLDSIYEAVKDPNEANLFDFVKNVLNKVSSYLGGVNSFDLSFDEDLQKWFIVDRNCIFPPKEKDENFVLQRIDPTGLKSTISDLSLQTKITPALTSQLAISAAASSRSLHSQVNTPLLEWNSDIVDRLALPELGEEKEVIQEQISNTPEITRQDLGFLDNNLAFVRDGSATGKGEVIDLSNLPFPSPYEFYRDEFIKKVNTLYGPFSQASAAKDLENADGIVIGQFYDNPYQLGKIKDELYESFKSEAIARFNNSIYGSPQTSSTIANTGLIPIELQLTLDGISGLKIGQIFELGNKEKSSNILPDIYDSYGFVITGLDSIVENNKWFTTIRGLTFKTESSKKVATGKF